MKIQKLTIHNIASIEDAVIDFEASPLADSEVFLITGKTGAGKSTILDSICLALYADTPRLDGTKMDGGTKDGDSSVSIDDPRQLMRKNTGEAFASLTFTGSNGTHYKATWSAARAYKKPTGNLQPKEWLWENLDTKKNLTKDVEIKKEIEAAIGLDFEQFRRTTLLAQGEFTRFLNSADKEKAEILEKITGVAIYSKIGKKIFDVTSAKKKDWDAVQQLAAATSNPSDEEILLKQTGIKELEVQNTTHKKQLDKENEKLQWLKTDQNLSEKLASAITEHERAVAEIESREFKEKETLVRQWNETIDARSWLRAKKNAEDSVAQQKDELKRLAIEYTKVLGGFEHAEQVRKNKELERNKLPEIKPEEEAQAKQQLDGMRKQRDNAKETLRNITTACDRIESYTSARDRRNQTEKNLEKALAEIQKKKEDISKMEPQLHDAKVKMDAQKELLDQQKDTIDKFARTLRQKLKVGEVCPVCRQEIKSELPHEDELTQLVNGLQNAFAEAESAYKELEKTKNKLDAEIKANTQSYQSAKDAFSKDNSVADAKRKVIEACKACGIETIEKTTPQALEFLKTEKESTIKDLEEKLKELEEKVSDIQKRIRERQTIDLQLTEIASKCQLAKDTLDDVLLQMPEWKTLSSSAVEEMPDLTKKANNLKSKTSVAMAQLRQAEDNFKQNSKCLDEFLQSHEHIDMERLSVLDAFTAQSISEKNSLLDEVRKTELSKKTLKEDMLRKKEEHGHIKPELTEDENVETLEKRISEIEKTMTGITEKKGALHQELKTAEENRKRYGQLKSEADKKKADYDKWARMNSYIGDATGSKFRRIAQSYVLSSLIHSANSYMNTLTDRYTLKVTPGTFVISIEDAYQGFASRAVSTISGGESFLVSLSLALALSDIGQRLAVDTLFIDEGFGTLSGEPLQNAVNTLRSLHNKAGRHVGIISHVEELKERIPVQIQVEQDGKNSNKSTITITS